MTVCVVFTIVLKTQAAADQFLAGFARMQEYVIRNEPGTLTYELFRDNENDLKFSVVERYNSMSDVSDVHFRSAAFSTLVNELVPSLEVAEPPVLSTMTSEPIRETLMELRQSLGDKAETDLSAAPKKGVLVFGGSRDGANPQYVEQAKALGTLLAQRDLPLIYGGGTKGIMGAVAAAAKAAGGQVIAVIPYSLTPREAISAEIAQKVYYTTTMSERKSIMFAHSNAVIALPGGIGTLDELLEVQTLRQLNSYTPPIGVVNVAGCFDQFFSLLDHLAKEEFVEKSTAYGIVSRPDAESIVRDVIDSKPQESGVAATALYWPERP